MTNQVAGRNLDKPCDVASFQVRFYTFHLRYAAVSVINSPAIFHAHKALFFRIPDLSTSTAVAHPAANPSSSIPTPLHRLIVLMTGLSTHGLLRKHIRLPFFSLKCFLAGWIYPEAFCPWAGTIGKSGLFRLHPV